MSTAEKAAAQEELIRLLGEEVHSAQVAFHCLGLVNQPSNPCDAAKLTIEYRKAQTRYYEANEALLKALESKS